ncbi:MAG TPA: hypothetical protein VFG06_00910 [Thermodesulfovibrionales bacterium]|nr:hypothetical protein [Thermodesulfovibrionales bacterium]
MARSWVPRLARLLAVHRAIWVLARLLALAAGCSSGAPQVPATLRALTTKLSVATTMHTCSACMRRGTGFPPTGVSHLRNPRRQPDGSPRLLQAIRRLQHRPGIDRRPTGPDNPSVCCGSARSHSWSTLSPIGQSPTLNGDGINML